MLGTFSRKFEQYPCPGGFLAASYKVLNIRLTTFGPAANYDIHNACPDGKHPRRRISVSFQEDAYTPSGDIGLPPPAAPLPFADANIQTTTATIPTLASTPWRGSPVMSASLPRAGTPPTAMRRSSCRRWGLPRSSPVVARLSTSPTRLLLQICISSPRLSTRRCSAMRPRDV